jgi:hypothetical protein
MCITIAANIAETGILTFPSCFPDSVVGFIADPRKANVTFVEYMFRFMRSRIQHQASGSVQDNINIETLERLRFPIPPLSTQRAIAHVLGTLDDLIEAAAQGLSLSLALPPIGTAAVDYRTCIIPETGNLSRSRFTTEAAVGGRMYSVTLPLLETREVTA